MPPGVLAPVPVSCVVGSKSEVSLLGYDACPTEVASNLRDCCPRVMCISGRDLCSRDTRSPFLAQWYDCLFFFILNLCGEFLEVLQAFLSPTLSRLLKTWLTSSRNL